MRAMCVAVLTGVALTACARSQSGSGDPWFVDATTSSGLAFAHVNGRTGQFYYPEVIAPGVALFDADGDGDLDVLLRQSTEFGPRTTTQQHTRFFRNDLVVRPDGTRSLTFTDATAQSGL